MNSIANEKKVLELQEESLVFNNSEEIEISITPFIFLWSY